MFTLVVLEAGSDYVKGSRVTRLKFPLSFKLNPIIKTQTPNHAESVFNHRISLDELE